MQRRSIFDFGTSTLEATISARAWIPIDLTVGGSRTAASGVPASYIVRRDAMLELGLRFWESEWASVLNLVAWGQTRQAITWFPDALDLLTSFEVYLEAPLAGERWAPQRDSNFPRTFEVSLTLRGVGAAVPWLAYFELSEL